MGEILLKDGVRYNLWTPENEPKEFEPMIIEHVKDIFGEGCEYFSKTKIETIPGISRIPDGFVTDFKNGKWYIVELKLLCDDAINRIGNQITDYKEINKKSQLKVISKSIKNQIENEKCKTLVSEIIFEKEPDIIVIINSLNGEKEVQFRKRAKEADKIIEFKTFEREDDPSDHVHLFEPVYVQKPTKPFEREIPESYRETTKEKVRRKSMKIIPQKEYRIPILKTLIELGGKGKMAEVLERVERRMGDKLTAQDREILSSGNEVRWRNHARWERKNMVDIGLLRNDSPHGVWEITKKGKEYYQSHK